MKYYVPKIIDGEIELLPDITSTCIFKDWDDIYASKSVRVVAALYQAVADRENYYQFHTPTAFGNPDYTMMQGIVIGIERAEEINEVPKDGKIYFQKGKRTILVVDKIKLHRSHYEAQKEIREIRQAFGL